MSPRGAGKASLYTEVNKRFKESKPLLRGKHVGKSPGGAYEKLLMIEISHEEKQSPLTPYSREFDIEGIYFLLRKIFVP